MVDPLLKLVNGTEDLSSRFPITQPFDTGMLMGIQASQQTESQGYGMLFQLSALSQISVHLASFQQRQR